MSLNNVNDSTRKPIRFNSDEEDRQYDDKRVGAFGWCCCCTSNGLTKLGLSLAIVGVLFLVAITIIIPLVIILKTNSGN
jgi:hypothetical protein